MVIAVHHVNVTATAHLRGTVTGRHLETGGRHHGIGAIGPRKGPEEGHRNEPHPGVRKILGQGPHLRREGGEHRRGETIAGGQSRGRNRGIDGDGRMLGMSRYRHWWRRLRRSEKQISQKGV
jgi:hypothetical protein